MTTIAITDKRLDDRREAIRLDEENKALREFAEWVASQPGCPYGASARSLLQKWAKVEGKACSSK